LNHLPDEKAELDTSGASRTKILELCGDNRRVIDVGCRTGQLAGELKTRGCYVLGIEPNPEAAEVAEGICDRVLVDDLDGIDLPGGLGGERFDVGIFDGVIEHLKDPRGILVQMREALSPGGFIIVSVSNVAHVSIRLMLLAGDFDYMDAGILDATNLRHYTRRSISDLLESCGYLVDTVDWTEKDTSRDDIRKVIDPLDILNSEEIIKALSSWEAKALRYIIKAFPAAEQDQVRLLSEKKLQAERENARLKEENKDLKAMVDELESEQDTSAELDRKRYEALEYTKRLEKEISLKNEYITALENEINGIRQQPDNADVVADVVRRLEILEKRLTSE
jgi:SAM-dependent methyltransferase